MIGSTDDYGVNSIEKQLKLIKKEYKLAEARNSNKKSLICIFWFFLVAYIFSCGMLIKYWNDSISTITCLIWIVCSIIEMVDIFKKRNLLNKYGPGNKNEITTLDIENLK